MRILIYGSTVLTSVVCRSLENYHEIIGYMPSIAPNFPGKMDKYKLLDNKPNKDLYDICISIQYDKKIQDTENTFNLHTGLLGDWGGCNILHHTIRSGAREQGLTFHKITSKIDHGPIVSKITYPVFENDDELNLYERMLLVAPNFCLSSIELLKNIKINDKNTLDECLILEPKIYRKKIELAEEELKIYNNMFNKIKQKLIDLGEINE